MRNNLFLIGGNGRLGLASLHHPAASRWSAPNMATGIGQAYESDPAGDRTKAHGKENPPTFYVVRLPSPTRAPSPRLLPTDHDYAVSTRGYQSDQPSHWPLVLSPARPFSSAQARLNLGLDTVAPYQKTYFSANCITRAGAFVDEPVAAPWPVTPNGGVASFVIEPNVFED